VQANAARQEAEAALAEAKTASAQAKTAKRQALEKNAKLQASLSVLGNVGIKQAQAAVDQELARNPSAANVLPRVYLQIVVESDRDHAREMGMKLRQAGFVVLGIEYVEHAARQATTDVRYYRRDDEENARKIADVLSQAGEGLVRTKYLPDHENDPRVRPNHYEVWFASRSGGPS
jgi:hypothetical protein